MDGFTSTSVYLREQLQHVINLAFEETFPALKARSFIPVNSTVPETAETVLARICGFETKKDILSEAVFSRAFADLAESGLLSRIHKKIVSEHYENRLVGHNSRDSTAIEAREKPIKKVRPLKQKFKKKRGRPRKGEARPQEPEPTRLARQSSMTLPQMLGDLPTACDVGSKRNSQGHVESWIGYKLHWDVGDGEVPLSVILTSASLHDSQVTLPLMAMSNEKVGLFFVRPRGWFCFKYEIITY